MCPERKGRTKRKLAVSRASSSSPESVGRRPIESVLPKELTSDQPSILDPVALGRQARAAWRLVQRGNVGRGVCTILKRYGREWKDEKTSAYFFRINHLKS